MSEIIIVLILFIVCNSFKALYLYVEMGLGFHLLLLHVISSLGFTTIFVLATLKRRRRILFVSWYLLHTFILFINTNYYEFYGKFLHLSSVYIFMPEIISLLEHFDVPLDINDLIFIVDLPLFLYLLNKHVMKELSRRKINIIIKSSAVITLPAMVMLLIVPVYNYEHTEKLVDYDIVSRFGIIGHNLFDLVKPAVNITSRIKYGHKITSAGIPGQRPNIILIQIESLDSNIVNYRYLGKFVTPFLHDLASKSLYFPFTLCYRKLGGTSDCEIAVNNSIEPPEDYALIMFDNYDYPNSVVKVLKKNGYKAEAFHGNVGAFYRRFYAYNTMGYDYFFDCNRMRLEKIGWGAPDQEVMNYVENHLHDLKTPFFVYIITVSSHEPFNLFKHFAPDSRFERVKPELTRRYFSAIAYTDRVVGKFITNIQKKYPDTYFFLYGDHTPYVINKGPFRRSVLNKNEEEEMEMVPLFIITPKGEIHYEHDAVASYLDIAPTILHIAGVPYNYRSLGVDLLANKALQQPVIYRGKPYNRSELFQEMSETYRDLWDNEQSGGKRGQP